MPDRDKDPCCGPRLKAPRVVSLTLADLYRRQGRVEEAASVLRALMESRPGDPELTRRLDELGALGEPVRRSARIAVLTALLARVRRRARVARG